MEHILAVDGGGTKCEALLMTMEGEALAFHAVYPETVSITGDYGRGRHALAGQAAVLGAVKACNPAGLVHMVGGSGAMTYQFRRDLKADHVLFWYATEEESARSWAGVKEALVALAGTGAFGHLCWKARHHHADGFGPLIGDWGGAYQIGREGLRAALRSYLHPGRQTSLRGELAREMKMKETDRELQSVMIGEGIRVFADRTAVARYAGMVDRAARAGDAVAIGILEKAAGELAETLQRLVEDNGAGGEALPFVGTGGVIMNSDIYWSALTRQVLGFLPGARPVRQSVNQVVGLALAGFNQAHRAGAVKADPEKVRERLCETFPAVKAAAKRQGAA